jgi:DNA-binding response OmpR family regulator
MARVLLLETDGLLAKAIADYLQADGHQVDWQVDPQEAIISIDVEPVDLVVLELILAGRSGVEFLYELRSYPDWIDLPVVIYTGIPQREVGASLGGFDQLNVKAYHQKQIDGLDTLSQTIEKSLSHAANTH